MNPNKFIFPIKFNMLHVLYKILSSCYITVNKMYFLFSKLMKTGPHQKISQ